MTIKTPEWHQWRCSAIFYEQVSLIVVVSIIEFRHVNADRVSLIKIDFQIILQEKHKTVLKRNKEWVKKCKCWLQDTKLIWWVSFRLRVTFLCVTIFCTKCRDYRDRNKLPDKCFCFLYVIYYDCVICLRKASFEWSCLD